MEFFINDPGIKKFPPAETHLIELRAEPDQENKRLRIALDLTPFLQRPVIEINLTDFTGKEVSSASIIEPVGWKLELTLHIRTAVEIAGKYTLTAILSYPDLGEVDRRILIIDLPVPAN